MSQSWKFNAIDTLFFRESRPMEAIGDSELGSVFPPPARTIIGAIRHALGETRQVNWSEFSEQHPVSELIGYGDNLGSLSYEGVWIHYKGKRLYPVPNNLIAQLTKNRPSEIEKIEFLNIGLPHHCDLGKQVRLPLLPKDFGDTIALSANWLTTADFKSIINGLPPEKEKLISISDLYNDEARLGIARDNSRRTVIDGMLYQTRHLRLQEDVSFVMDVKGLAENKQPPSQLNRLGGEGRLAHFQIESAEEFFPAPKANNQTYGLILYLLTPALITQNSEYTPLPNFEKVQLENQQTTWQGQLNSINLILHCAIIGKAIREGGWNLAEHKPRDVESLVPAGSAFYCTIKDTENNTLEPIQEAIDTLHGYQIGEDTKLGRGKIAVGLWLNKYNQDKGE